MLPAARTLWNARFSESSYTNLLEFLEREAGVASDFRISETPIFLDRDLALDLEQGAWEILRQASSPQAVASTERFAPRAWRVPGGERYPHPAFAQIDFALVEVEPGRLAPRLIELQGFPSLYGFQWLLARGYRECFDAVPEGFTTHFGGLDEESYVDALRETIVGDGEPGSTVLLEIAPDEQKTRIDFHVTRRMLGIPVVDALTATRRGRRLFYRDDEGREREIHRIYNRVIFDEVERKGFDAVRDLLLAEDLEARWIGHPDWYFRISKASLPALRSAYCPRTRLVSDVLANSPEMLDDLGDQVLKPLFSFAGLGVELGPSRARVQAIPELERDAWVLQQRIEYAPAFATPDAPARAEVRMMFLWPDAANTQPRLVNSLVRMSKGAMMGVDFNKNKTWVGASVAFHPPL